eukprot:ANDGO_05584.mRNA.1 Ultraviolet-B receptor UVR8
MSVTDNQPRSLVFDFVQIGSPSPTSLIQDHGLRMSAQSQSSVSKYRIQSISCHTMHTLILTACGRVFSFGYGCDGRLGHGSQNDEALPREISFFSSRSIRIVKISAGFEHSVFLDDTGKAYACGSNAFGQLGQGPKMDHIAMPREIQFKEGFQNIVDIAAGGHHTVFLTKRGIVMTCGRSDFGQTGLGNVNAVAIPEVVVLYDMPIRSIFAGFATSAVISNSGQLLTCGFGKKGALGRALPTLAHCSATFQPVTFQSPDLILSAPQTAPVRLVSLGYDHLVVVLEDSSVWWSGPADGRCIVHTEPPVAEDGERRTTQNPVQMTLSQIDTRNLFDPSWGMIQMVEASRSHTCFLFEDGTFKVFAIEAHPLHRFSMTGVVGFSCRGHTVSLLMGFSFRPNTCDIRRQLRVFLEETLQQQSTFLHADMQVRTKDGGSLSIHSHVFKDVQRVPYSVLGGKVSEAQVMDLLTDIYLDALKNRRLQPFQLVLSSVAPDRDNSLGGTFFSRSKKALVGGSQRPQASCCMISAILKSPILREMVFDRRSVTGMGIATTSAIVHEAHLPFAVSEDVLQVVCAYLDSVDGRLEKRVRGRTVTYHAHLNEKTAMEVLVVADYLMLPGLKNLAEEVIMSCVAADQIDSVREFGHSVNSDPILQFCSAVNAAILSSSSSSFSC